MKTLQLHANRVSRSTLVVMAAQAVVLLASPASARRAANRTQEKACAWITTASISCGAKANVSREAPAISVGNARIGIRHRTLSERSLILRAPTLLARLPGLLRIARRQRSPGSRRPPPFRRARTELLAKAMAGHSRPPPHRPVPSQSLPRPWRAGHRSSQALTAGRDGRAGSAARNVAASPGSRRR